MQRTTPVLHHSTAFHDIGPELLAKVLQHVPQKDRLYNSARVSRTWHQAANMATITVECCTYEDGFDSFSAWLHSNEYSSKIKTIKAVELLSYTGRPLLQLPAHKLEHLQQLDLSYCTLDLTVAECSHSTTALTAATSSTTATVASAATSAASSAGSIAALAGLRTLHLNSAHLDVTVLSSCTGLQHLEASNLCHVAAKGCAAEAAEARLIAALPQLTNLTHLSLQWERNSHNMYQLNSSSTVTTSLSSLQSLQELRLSVYGLQGLSLAQLPANLTLLYISGAGCRAPSVNTKTMPGLSELTRLQHLHISGAPQVDAALLSSLTQLTDLSTGVLELQLVYCEIKREAPVDKLLVAPGHLTQLKVLSLYESLAAGASVESGQSYAALTASSCLQSLDISQCVFPFWAEIVVFSDTCTAKSLTALKADATLFTMSFSFERMTACFPRLRQLQISSMSSLSSGINKGITALTCLTELIDVEFSSIHLTFEALSSISACTQLEVLNLHVPGCWAPADKAFDGMMQLTQLTKLTSLRLNVQVGNKWLKEHMGPHAFSIEEPPPALYERLQAVVEKWRNQEF